MNELTCAWCWCEPVVFLHGVLPACQEHGRRLSFGILRAMYSYPDGLPAAFIAELMLGRVLGPQHGPGPA